MGKSFPDITEQQMVRHFAMDVFLVLLTGRGYIAPDQTNDIVAMSFALSEAFIRERTRRENQPQGPWD